MTQVAGRTIKISKKQIQRRKFRDALQSFFSGLANLFRRWFGPPTPKPTPIRIKPPQGVPAGNENGNAVTATTVAARGRMKIGTKVKNCPVCMSPFRDDLPTVKCRRDAAHAVHQACSTRVSGKCPLDGHALV